MVDEKPASKSWRRVNVIVGLLVFAILVALAIPFITYVRSTAANMQCQNQLKQIGLALTNYQDTLHVYPRATVDSTNELPPDSRLSWYVEIGPYLESDPLWRTLKRDQAWDSPVNLEQIDTPDSRFDCVVFRDGPHWRGPGTTPYPGLSGVGVKAAEYPLEDRRCGFFGYDRQLRRRDIKDGAANTIAVLESWRDNGFWAQGGHATVRGVDPEKPPYLGEGGQFETGHQSGYWFKRHALTHALLADFSVRRMRTTVEPAIVEALATVAGGEEIPDW